MRENERNEGAKATRKINIRSKEIYLILFKKMNLITAMNKRRRKQKATSQCRSSFSSFLSQQNSFLQCLQNFME
jgi:hypothetical protein